DTVKIENFYRLWISRLDEFLENYIYYEIPGEKKRKLLPTRYIFSYYLKILNRFLEGEIDELEKIHILTGLRGTGKTTLLAQLYYADKFVKDKQKSKYQTLLKSDYEKLYLDVSRLKSEDISLNDFFKFYETAKNIHFESTNRKFLILLDEIHYDDNWGLFLKSFYDRTKANKNILIVATGSSALKLKISPDLSRRSISNELYPLKFNEFLILKYNLYPEPGLFDEILNAVFMNKGIEESYKALKDLLPKVNNFYHKLEPNIEMRFLELGGLPFLIKSLNNAILIYDFIDGMVDKIITKDILSIAKLKAEPISKIKDILFLLANSEITDLQKICSTVKLDYKTLRKILDYLVLTGLLYEIRSFGGKFSKTRKPIKFLFSSPSIRNALLKGVIGSEVRGRFLEDYFALIYFKDIKKLAESKKIFSQIAYDSSEQGADFILTIDKDYVAVEMGFNKRAQDGLRQIKNTFSRLKKNGNIKGVIFGEDELKILEDNIIHIPLKFLFLM
ncbi:MAG: ATP-binding protein, partial [Candidatus Ratteibacteria bacterium]